jgi:hypothetical protein
MLSSDLQHGDVLAYIHRKNAGLLVDTIHLIEGSDYTHSSVVLEIYNNEFILEQHSLRMHSYLPLYYALSGEEIYCFRPRFTPPPATFEEFNRDSYGILGIIDSLLNHTIGLIIRKWQYRPLLVRLFNNPKIICSALVAKVLDLEHNTKWCKYYQVVEPDDFANHPEDFEPLGLIEWENNENARR